MRLNPSPEALAEQMLLLTLAADQAFSREDWQEAEALMDRRAQILSRLETVTITPSASAHLDQVQRLEATLLGRMNAQRSNLIGDIIQERRQNHAAATYRQAGSQAEF